LGPLCANLAWFRFAPFLVLPYALSSGAGLNRRAWSVEPFRADRVAG
jgi:hypothetical protein